MQRVPRAGKPQDSATTCVTALPERVASWSELHQRTDTRSTSIAAGSMASARHGLVITVHLFAQLALGFS